MIADAGPGGSGAPGRVRPPAVAGTFYAGAAEALESAVREAFADAVIPPFVAAVP